MEIKGLKEIAKAPAEWPEVFEYRINLDEIQKGVAKYSQFPNIIIIGNGGSITSFDAFSKALGTQKNVFVLSTMEPRLIEKLKSKYRKEDTLIIAVSKSGNTLGLIESLLAFVDYPVLAITNSSEGTLSQMAKVMNWDIIDHPNVGGRFSAGTAAAIVPAILSGLNAGQILAGLYDGYQSMRDQAYSLSKELFELENKEMDEIYLPIYSYYLTGFQNLIVQLMHESVCKDGKGQTFYAALAPESQHHTNQRFLGGKKNVAGIFITYTDNNDLLINVPASLEDIEIRAEKLAFINNIPYQEALRAEYLGTKEDADHQGITNFTIELDGLNEHEVGELVAFWHMMAYYGSIIRGVNPFDQPAVEASKQITLEKIKK